MVRKRSKYEEHIDTVDLVKPVVIAEIASQRYNVIDGHHRMEKARRESVTTLSSYRIPPEGTPYSFAARKPTTAISTTGMRK